MEDAGGIPWVLILSGVVILGLVIAYGILHSRRLSRREKAAQQSATRENFRVDEDSS